MLSENRLGVKLDTLYRERLVTKAHDDIYFSISTNRPSSDL
jgi:hypothetical protein